MSHAVWLQFYYWSETIVQNNAHSAEIKAYLPEVMRIAQQAGGALSTFFYSGFAHQITIKSDQSPVTQADVAANQILVESLTRLTPHIPILSEENHVPDFETRQQWSQYWLLDPLDGTRGFIRHIPEFCVNIALIDQHEPVLGVVYSPIEQYCYYAIKNQGAFFLDVKTGTTQQIFATQDNTQQLRLVCGHFDQRLEMNIALQKKIPQLQVTQMNSALKFPHVARGLADIYVRMGSTSEWDTAAGQCIVEAAGGAVVDFAGNPLHYNAKSSLINPSFIAVGDVAKLQWFREMLKV